MEHRPDPDKLLARVKHDEARQGRGRLKIYFGAAPGVGKTYAMLSEAREKRGAGVDVVVGIAETHDRVETEQLLGMPTLRGMLPILPRRRVEYRGVTLEEFDLDAALARRPQLIVVDELAHTNAPGSRHAKRWQDVQELLDAGIDVYTTVNVQHIESLNDVVAQITGVVVRETVPDSLVEEADELELVDLTPDDLLERLKEGKVYVPNLAERAVKSFFRKGNLIALRELALRRTADRVDAQMEDYRREQAIREPWPAATRLLVGVSSGPSAARLVRAARRVAAGLRAEWVVAYVETPGELRRPESDRDQVVQTLRLAEQLGAETVTLTGANAADELLAFARERNVSRIVIGRPERPRWRDFLFGSVADDLIRRSGVIDIYVTSGDSGDAKLPLRASFQTTSTAGGYLWGVLTIVLCTVVAALMAPVFADANLIMVYLLGVTGVAVRFGRGPSALAAVLSVLAFDFFFVPPQLTFAVSDVQYLVTFAVMLVVGLVISNLTVRLSGQAEAARARERRTAALYALSRELASTRGLDNLLRAAVQHVHEVFDSQVVVLLPTAGGRLQPWGNVSGWAREISSGQVFAPNPNEQGVAEWVFEHQQMAGLGTETLPAAEALYLPLVGSQRTVGVLGVRPDHPRRVGSPEQIHMLETFASQTALAIERATLASEAQQAHVTAETERMRAALLSSVSHDLRTPLAVITGATSTLLHGQDALDPTTKDDLLRTAYEESERLNRLVGNLLDMTRLEAGAIRVRKEWQPLEEVIGAAIGRVEHSPETAQALRDHPLTVELSPELPLVPLDGAVIEQVLVNLLDNALKHTPAGTAVGVRAWAEPGRIVVEVADRGPGLPPGDEREVFEKFYRGQPPADGRESVGLGLAICRGMIDAHGGQIWAEPRPGGGVAFRFALPLEGEPPSLPDAVQQRASDAPAS